MKQTLHSILQGAGLSVPQGFVNPLIEDVICDSRSAREGTLFLGFPGETVDGGDFWPQALSAGSSAAVISSEAAKSNPPGLKDPVIILPEPVSQWIGELAAVFWGRPSQKMVLIGVTGTNGKTTTAHLIEHLSQVVGMPASLFGTLINRWPSCSVAATHTTAFADKLQEHLARAVQAGAKLGAMEVSSHALAQYRVAGCRFSGAIFTNLTQDHLDYHLSMEEYFESKARLFQEPLVSDESKMIVNIDDVWGRRLSEQLGEKCWRSSLLQDSFNPLFAELTITDLEITPEGTQGLLHTPHGSGKFVSSLVGRFNMMNLLQAVGSLVQQGLPLSKLLEAVQYFPGVPGRLQLVKVDDQIDVSNLPMVLVDYAHTPDGLKNALLASRPLVKGKLFCVFGCGGDRDKGKRPQMGSIAAAYADQSFLTSDNPRTEDPEQILADVLQGMPNPQQVYIEVNRSLAIERAITEASSKDVVLIAGKGHEDYQIIGTNKIHFDDREEAQKALKNVISKLI